MSGNEEAPAAPPEAIVRAPPNENGTMLAITAAATMQAPVAALRDPSASLLSGHELPFLVTHWLANFRSSNDETAPAAAAASVDRDALQRIHRAASELASAFGAVGAFGTATAPMLSSSLAKQGSSSSAAQQRHASYADVKRSWAASCPPNQLERLLSAAATAGAAAENAAAAAQTPNLVALSGEARIQQMRHPATGRTLDEAIDMAGEQRDAGEESASTGTSAAAQSVAMSALQPPVLLAASEDSKPASTTRFEAPQRESAATSSLPLTSSFAQTASQSAEMTRLYLNLRDKCVALSDQLRQLQRSLAFQTRARNDYAQQREALLAPPAAAAAVADATAMTRVRLLDEIKEGQANVERVTHQLQRQIMVVQKQYETENKAMVQAAAASRAGYHAARRVWQGYRDPLGVSAAALPSSSNRVFWNLTARQGGCLAPRHGGAPRRPCFAGRAAVSRAVATDVRRAVLAERLSHAATVNCHVAYPIYCLRFDRTGRYFVTGADDYLARVFCMGHGVTRKGRAGGGAAAAAATTYPRGAVLVCTLRGHAGVINDVAISSDNALLATASEDGDCRVWGLRDGAPVAILRGHVGGANMVSWSTLTPYRLVTVGADGWARSWDIREACLKRYGGVVGRIPEYRRRPAALVASAAAVDEGRASVLVEEVAAPAGGSADMLLPPIPVRQGAGGNEGEPAALAALPLPPLPPAAAPVPGQQQPAAGQGAPAAANPNPQNDGSFVAGDAIDEGVKLLSKLQHGASIEEQVGLPGTRSRRARVKVLCVAQCPLGGQFATGSDDGICRVFSSSDDPYVRELDEKRSKTPIFSKYASSHRKSIAARRRAFLGSQLLHNLKGHLSAITDLSYSNAGDRILTASQKDGVVRLWTCSYDTINPARSQVSHILIKLTNPNATTPEGEGQSSRRRPNRSATASVSCDVATWLQDDTKVLTSQCVLAKQTATEILPGSQFLFLWDSRTGHCLLGISSAHTMQCAVVIPHPTDSSIACSAGADGVLSVWNLESGKSLFSHKNTVDFGPIEPRDRGKSSGYLDGSFSPDGTALVMTDESGRVIVFDSYGVRIGQGPSSSNAQQPGWMKEQYFANDYYDLFYDEHGYCVELGSQQPPHLAPRGARCSHLGAPWAAAVNESFKGIVGPLPCAEQETRWKRELLRYQAETARNQPVSHHGSVVGQYDPQTTTIVGQCIHPRETTAAAPLQARETSAQRSPARLSSNWRWSDYDDVLGEEGVDNIGEEPDSDDDSFELNETRQRDDSRFSDEELDYENMQEEDNQVAAPSRSSSRPASRRYADDDLSENDDFIEECMSTNNTPSGPFVADYDTFFFRLLSSIPVDRHWLRRGNSSNSSYQGLKSYAPQVGDQIVYIPRAHFETIDQFPSLIPPWQNWPEEAVWPVVRCCIRDIRYRFPFKAYFGSSRKSGPICRSVVAVLTLEVSGIPELDSDRDFHWPKPSFITPTRRHMFELSLFVNENTDFVIPVGTYMARLKKLERALDEIQNPRIEAYFTHNNDPNDPDPEYEAFEGAIVNDIEDNDQADPNLCGSGFRCLQVQWNDGGAADTLSPWEVSALDIKDDEEIDRPRLAESEKRAARNAINVIRGVDGVDAAFLHPVNTEVYSDYNSRVEVPMDLSFVKTRLEGDFYGNKLSVIADVKLIRDNCRKYNGEDELTSLADEMYSTFKINLLDANELQSFNEFEESLEAAAAQKVPAINEDSIGVLQEEATGPSDPASASGLRRSSRQPSAHSLSATLHGPTASSTVTRRTRRRSTQSSRQSGSGNSASRTRIRIPNGRSSRQSLRNRRSVLETETDSAAAGAVPLNAGTRGRITRNASGQHRGRQLRTRQSSNGLAEAVGADTGNTTRRSRSERAAARAGPLPAAASRRSGRVESLARPTRSSTSRGQAPPSPSRPHRQIAAAPSYADVASDVDMAESGFEQDNDEPSSDGEFDEHMEATLPVARRQPSRNSPRRRTAEAGGDSPGEDEGLRSSVGLQQAATSRSSGRRPRRSHHDDSSEEEPTSADEDNSESEEDEEPVARRRTSRAAARRKYESDDDESAFEQPISNRRRPSRKAANRTVKQEESSEEDESGDDESPRGPTRRSTRRNTAQSEESPAVLQSATRNSRNGDRSTRRSGAKTHSENNASSDSGGDTKLSASNATRRRKKSYLVPSSDEFSDHIGDSGDEEEDDSESKRQAKPAAKRKAPGQSGAKQKKRRASSKKENIAPENPWPSINIRSISKVTKVLLRKLRDLDDFGAFSAPVAEQFPQIADAYLAVVEHPMDFRTIEEERIHSYHAIQELQNDLVLMCDNCIKFNSGDENLVELATLMLSVLNTEFIEACRETHVSLPQTWVKEHS